MRSITFLRKLKENKRFLTLFPLPRERIGVIVITQNAKDMVGMDYKEALEYINLSLIHISYWAIESASS